MDMKDAQHELHCRDHRQQLISLVVYIRVCRRGINSFWVNNLPIFCGLLEISHVVINLQWKKKELDFIMS